MVTAVLNDDLFTREVTNDPYTYGRLREEDPVHWNELYELWVITRHDDLVWLTRHHELFSSEVLKRDPRPPYPQVDAADLGLYEYVRDFSSDQFIQHDRPEHLEMQGHPWVFYPQIHGGLAPHGANRYHRAPGRCRGTRADGWWRLCHAPARAGDRADDGRPHRGPALHRGVGQEASGRGPGSPDRLRTQTAGMQGMLEYLSPLVAERRQSRKRFRFRGGQR